MQESGDTNYFVALRSIHNAGDTFLLHGLKGEFLKHIRTNDSDENTHTLRLGGALPRVDIVANNSVRMLVDENGKVGIGTTSPESLAGSSLHIRQSSTDASINLDDKGHYHLVLQNNDSASTNTGRHVGMFMQINSNSAAADASIYTEFEEDGGAKLHFTTTKSGTGQERMVIDHEGRVGIGTVNPTSALTIRGTSNGTAGFAYPSIAGYTGNTQLYALEQHFGNEGRLALYYDGVVKVLFRASGSSYINSGDSGGGSTLNFGIGTSSPTYKLHVNGTAFAKNLTLSGWSSGDGLTLNYGNAAGTVEAVSFLANGGTNGNIKMVMNAANSGDMHFNASNRSNQIVAYRDGNVGIGTNVPSQLLDVYGSIQVYSDLRLYNGQSIRFHGNGVVGMNSSATTQTFGSTAGSVNTHFSVGGVTAAMMISGSTGNVGIGETNPGAKLHVSTADSGVTPNAVADDLFVENNTHGGITIGTPNSVSGYLFFADPEDNAGAGINYNHSTNKMSIAAGGTTRVTIDSSGNVGIGDTTPSYKLDVDGTGRFTGQVIVPGGSNTTPGLMFDSSNDGFFHDTADPGQGIKMMVNNANDFLFANGGDFHADGSLISNSTTISDSRFKTNISTITSPVDKVKQLRGVTFDWMKGKQSGSADIGVIAQEVEAVFPELVQNRPLPLWETKDASISGSYKTVDYERLAAVLIESVKEQQTKLEQLEAEIEKLKGG